MQTDEFITALGGPKAAASLFGVSRTTPYSWLSRGLPARFHLRALRLATERGLDFDPEAPGEASNPRASADDRRPTNVRAEVEAA